MDINLNKLKSMPTHFQIIIAALPSVIFIALFIFLIFLPKNEQITSLNAKLVKIDQEIASSEVKIKRLDELIVENKALKAKLAKLREQLPEEKEVSVLLKQISELGLRSGLEILFWKPEARKTQPEGLYVEIPVKVEVMAEYHKLGDFFSRISRLPRLVNISDIDLTAGRERQQQREGIINVKLMARTFASVSPGDVVPAAQGKKK